MRSYMCTYEILYRQCIETERPIEREREREGERERD